MQLFSPFLRFFEQFPTFSFEVRLFWFSALHYSNTHLDVLHYGDKGDFGQCY